MHMHVHPSKLVAAVLVPAALALSACGEDPEDKKGGGGTADVTPTVTAAPTVVPVVTPIPHAPEPPLKISGEATHSGQPSTFKTCHGMTTKASFYPHKNHVFGSTTIWSHCGAGGFTGSVFVQMVDDFGAQIGVSYAPESWGVQGKLEATLAGGLTDRTNLGWDAPVQWSGPADASMVHHIEVVNYHAPRNRLVEIVGQGMAAGKKAKEIYDQLNAEFPSS
jgi:hypothetical protein